MSRGIQGEEVGADEVAPELEGVEGEHLWVVEAGRQVGVELGVEGGQGEAALAGRQVDLPGLAVVALEDHPVEARLGARAKGEGARGAIPRGFDVGGDEGRGGEALRDTGAGVGREDPG